MKKELENDNFLLISGIQHIAFCERQWALIHIEQIWAENVRTVEGKQLHERVDDRWHDESRKNIRVVRSMPLISKRLRLQGVADVVEFHQSDTNIVGETCKLDKRRGWWQPVPVEYKRGRAKQDDCDAVQLCAQAMALEEMLGVFVPYGYLFYGQTKRRQKVVINENLRQRTMDLATRMYFLFDAGITPGARKGKHCAQCSLLEDCQPDLASKNRSVASYIKRMCEDVEV